MDIKRITSGLLGFPLVLIILLLGNKIIVDIALAIIALLAMSEYFNAIKKVAKPVEWLGYVSCFSIAFIHIVPQEYLNMVVTLSVPTILIILFAQVIATEMRTSFKDIAYTFLGIFYVVFFIMFVAFINGMPNGNILIWYALFAAWGTDIFAYFIGKYIGKHKFSKVSPKKSIERLYSRNNRSHTNNAGLYICSKQIFRNELFIPIYSRNRFNTKLSRSNRRLFSL